MIETSSDVDVQLQQVNERLGRIEERLKALEAVSHRKSTPEHRPAPVIVAAAVESPGERSLIALFGRSLLGIGGAYLLRALTESNVVPHALGVILGLAYAFAWIWFTDRLAAREDRVSATFAAAVAAMIGFPLIWEATERFGSFSIGTAVGAMLAVSAALLFVAMRRSLVGAAWIVSVGAAGCTAGLMAASEQVALPLIVFTLISAFIWHLAGQNGWPVVAWPAIAFACAASVVLQLLVVAHRGGDAPATAAVALLTVAVVYAGAVSAKTLLWRREMTTPDIIATAAMIVVALAGGARIASGIPHLDLSFTIAIAALAIGSYTLGVRQHDRLESTGHYFAAIGVACTLIATAIPLTRSAAGVLWSSLAAASLGASALTGKRHFGRHAIVYAFAGAGAANLLVGSLATISGVGTAPHLTAARVTATIILAATAFGALLLRDARRDAGTRTPTMILMSLGAVVVIAAVVNVTVTLAAGDAASAAAIRSAILAATAITLAMLGRSRHFADAALLVYPVLGLGAAKFVVDDFIAGRAATLFVTLAIYGCTLLVLSRLRKMGVQQRATPL